MRIFPIYWFFALLVSGRLIHSHQFSLQKYLPSLFLLPNVYPRYPLLVRFSWTLIFAMFFYYTFAATLLFTVRRAVSFSIAFLSASVLLGHFVGIRRPIWIIVSNPMLLEFILGAILALLFLRFGQRRKLGIVAVLVGAAIALYLRAHPEQGGADGINMVLTSVDVMRRVLTWGIAATMIVGGIIFWSPSIQSRPGKIAVILGNASYSTYLASALLIEYSSRLFTRPGEPLSLLRLAVAQTLIVIIVFAGGWLCYQCVEWPMLRWLRTKL